MSSDDIQDENRPEPVLPKESLKPRFLSLALSSAALGLAMISLAILWPAEPSEPSENMVNVEINSFDQSTGKILGDQIPVLSVKANWTTMSIALNPDNDAYRVNTTRFIEMNAHYAPSLARYDYNNDGDVDTVIEVPFAKISTGQIGKFQLHLEVPWYTLTPNSVI